MADVSDRTFPKCVTPPGWAKAQLDDRRARLGILPTVTDDRLWGESLELQARIQKARRGERIGKKEWDAALIALNDEDPATWGSVAPEAERVVFGKKDESQGDLFG